MVPRIKLSQRKNRVAGIFFLKYFAEVRPGSRGPFVSAKGPKTSGLRRDPGDADARRIQ